MKLKINSAAKKPGTLKKIKSPKKQSKGVEVRKEKSKNVVKPSVLKKEAEKSKPEVPLSPKKTLVQELWFKAIDNVSNKSNLSDQESNIAKLLSNYKNKSSVPQKKAKLKNFITKGFGKYKDTSDETFDGLYDKLLEEFKALRGNTEITSVETIKKKSEKNIVKSKTKSLNDKVSNNKETDIGGVEKDVDDENNDVNEDDDDDNDDDDDDDDVEGIEFGDSDDDIEEESEEEKLIKPIAKIGNNKNGKSLPVKAKNGSKFKSGKVQKNKKFGKKK